MSDNLPDKSNTISTNSVCDAKKILGARNKVFRNILECRITRENPCAIVILVDQSKSMGNLYLDEAGNQKRIGDEVSKAINQIINELITKATNANDINSIREYYTFLVIGYGNEQKENIASPAWIGKLEGKEWVGVKELSENIEEVNTTLISTITHWGEAKEERRIEKIWIRPKYDGENTPMLSALSLCYEKLNEFIETRSDNYPPLVFNITDGYPTDINDLSELINISEKIKSIETAFGKTVLFNCLMSNRNEYRTFLPKTIDAERIKTNKFHAALYECSSTLPEFMVAEAYATMKDEKFNGQFEIKALTLNVNSENKLTRIFKIGTNFTVK